MDKTDDILFAALGGGASIGASAYLVRIGATAVVIDFGIDPNVPPVKTFHELVKRARASGIVSSLTDVSAVVLTHAHTDHTGLLPALYRMFRQEEKPVPPFHASRATKGLVPLVYDNIAKFLQEVPYGKADVEALLEHLRSPEEDDHCIDWRRPERGTLWFHPTSHLLGARMVELKVGNRIVLHTGDLRLKATPTLGATRLPELAPDLLIIDGTYASAQPKRVLRDWEHTRRDLFELLDRMLERRSIVLLPSFALGRSQDVLALTLEHAELRNADYYVYLDGQSQLVTQSIYPRFKDELLPGYIDLVERHKWRIRSVDHTVGLDQLIHTEIVGYPTVIIASSGMLLPGSASRQWAEALLSNPNHFVALTGYIPEDILEEVFDRGLFGEEQLPQSLTHLGCSSHASVDEIEDLVLHLNPRAVVIVHCGDGDPQGPGSLFARLNERGIPTAIGSEGKLIRVSERGVQIHGY